VSSLPPFSSYEADPLTLYKCSTRRTRSQSSKFDSPRAVLSDSTHALALAQNAIKAHGSKADDGKMSVSYGILFDKTADTRELAC
jgi:hypothetical protein